MRISNFRVHDNVDELYPFENHGVALVSPRSDSEEVSKQSGKGMSQGVWRRLSMPDDTPYHGLVARTRTAPYTGKKVGYHVMRKLADDSLRLPTENASKVQLTHAHLRGIEGRQNTHAEGQLSDSIEL